MDLRLTGKIALVTGSTAGIGFAIAKSLASEGAHVYVNGRTQQRVDAATAAIRSHAAAAKVGGIVADFSGSAGAEAVIAKLPAVDVLVNNVGIFEPKSFAGIPDADWYRLFEINVMSGVRLSRHYLAGVLERNWGRILFISSESGVQIPAEMVHYGMTKTAQIAVARGIAESVAGTGVTVNSILAGPTESEGVGAFVEAMAKQENKSKAEVEKQFFEHVRPSSLLKRFATVDEVAGNRDTRIYHQPNPPFRGSSGRYARRLDKSQGKGNPFREGSATASSRRPPGSQRNEHELTARHRATHRDGTTTHSRWRVDRVLGFELA